jgi:hypothetical protein
VSFRNCCLVDLSVMKRRPVAVVQTCAATDVCWVSFPADCRCRAGNRFAPGLQSVSGTSRFLKRHVGGATCCRSGGFWGWRGGPLSWSWNDGLSTESRHLVGEVLDAPEKLVIARQLANARECWWRNSLGDAVCTVGRGVQHGL